MILNGSQRGGAYDLARHLLKDENERVEVFEIRGFVSQDLLGALQESYAVSKATKCARHMYSLSLNPPPGEQVSNAAFEKAINKAEERLNLENQPRAVVFHEKNGRRHAHVVWCRIDVEQMKARQISYDHTKLKQLSRELFIEHDWTMPPGLLRAEDRNPRNYTLAEWQQAKRAGKDIEKLKGMFQDCWSISDTRAAFAHALKERGYILAKGDRRGFIAVDRDGEAYSVSRYVGVKAKQVREKFGAPGGLPDRTEAHAKAAQIVTARLEELQAEQEAQAAAQRKLAQEKAERLQATQAQEAEKLRQKQIKRRALEDQRRALRLRSGFWGWIDRFTGRRKRVLQENAAHQALTLRRDAKEAKDLAWLQAGAREIAAHEVKTAPGPHLSAARELAMDSADLNASVAFARAERDAAMSAMTGKPKRSEKPRRKRRSRSRDGPSPG